MSVEVSRVVHLYFDLVESQLGVGGSLSPEVERVLDEMTCELLSVMEQHLGVAQFYASRYLMLPSILKEFFDSGPDCMFTLGSKVCEAVVARVVVDKIGRLVAHVCRSCGGGRDECFIIKTKRLLVESGLYTPGG